MTNEEKLAVMIDTYRESQRCCCSCEFIRTNFLDEDFCGLSSKELRRWVDRDVGVCDAYEKGAWERRNE